MARHLAVLDDLLVSAAGGGQRIAISLPPRHGKSKLVSETFPAWYLGTFPDRRVMLASYEADFASTWGGHARDLLEREGSRFGVRVNSRSSARHRWELAGNGGGMLCAGVGGPLTGSGADVFIIDDPIKNAEEAHSALQRDRLWDWYQSVAYPRLEPNASVIVVMTRWHEDDLIGRLEAHQPGRWKILRLPALAEEGDPLGREIDEPLWPERFPGHILAEIKATVGGYWWNAQYQQRPAPLEGGFFKRDWFRTFQSHDGALNLAGRWVERSRCRVFCTVDLAVSTRTSADYTAIATWLVTPTNDLLLFDLDRRRMEAPDLVPALRATYERHHPTFLGVERVGFQLAIIQEARRHGLPILEMSADVDKLSRALPAAARMEGGQIWWANGAQWREQLESELLAFPHGRHDDMVDVLAYAVKQVIDGYAGGMLHVSSPAKLGRRVSTVAASTQLAKRRMGLMPAVSWLSDRDSIRTQ
jgi:predicted phage terminase large subunit-like protein